MEVPAALFRHFGQLSANIWVDQRRKEVICDEVNHASVNQFLVLLQYTGRFKQVWSISAQFLSNLSDIFQKVIVTSNKMENKKTEYHFLD